MCSMRIKNEMQRHKYEKEEGKIGREKECEKREK